MDAEVVKQYLIETPIQIRELVESLDDDNTWAVYGALLRNQQMGFNQIKELFKANSSQIDRALKSLISGGLIFKRARAVHETDINNRAYYELSSLGQEFYNAMFDLVIPASNTTPKPIRSSGFGRMSIPARDSLTSINGLRDLFPSPMGSAGVSAVMFLSSSESKRIENFELNLEPFEEYRKKAINEIQNQQLMVEQQKNRQNSEDR